MKVVILPCHHFLHETWGGFMLSDWFCCTGGCATLVLVGVRRWLEVVCGLGRDRDFVVTGR